MNIFKKIIELPENLYYHIKFFCDDVRNETIWSYQRLFRGYDDRWRWDVAGELTPILIDCLTFYKNETSCYPSSLANREEWNKILDDIILGFKARKEIDFLFQKEFKTDDDLLKEYRKLEKIKIRGMKLFSKYYDSLWD
jgi:hypothetical protein